MAWVTGEFLEVWDAGQHVGADTPKAVVQIQRGGWHRGYHAWTGPPVNASVWGEGGYGDDNPNSGYWYPVWVPASGWVDVPNLHSIKRTKDFKQNGVTVLELVIDALDAVPMTGALGDAYQVFQPGYLAADRGVVIPQQPDPGWPSTPWTTFITDSVKIRVWQGYGDPETDLGGNCPPITGGTNGCWTFSGQVDDVDLDADPNQITITARNGKLLTDQHCFGWAKSKRIDDPVQFYDNLAATQLTMVGRAPAASSSAVGRDPANVIDLPADPWRVGDPAYQTYWQSGVNIDGTNLEWVDIRLPQGTYDECWLNALTGMTAYLGIFAHSIVHHTRQAFGNVVRTVVPPRMDGANLPVGWVDVGAGTAPGSNGGWNYIRTFTTGQNPPPALAQIDRPHFGHSFDLGERSVLRLGFTHASGGEAAKVFDLHAFRRTLIDDVEDARFILVPDASDVVKVALRWAGYTDWEVEDSGVRISDGRTYNAGVTGVMRQSGKLVFDRTKYLIDIVTAVAKQLGFVFFIADPVDANSDGIPTFRRDSSLLVDNNYIAADLRDGGNLTGLKRKDTDADRPAIIRVRGRTTDTVLPGSSSPASTAANPSDGGLPLGGDKIKRIMAVYVPPWAYADPFGGPYHENAGGIVRHVNYQNDGLITYAMCLMGCFLIALNAALEMYKVTAECPANPNIELDDQVRVLNEATAVNSRMWVVQVEDTMELGENVSWKMTLGGALQDTADFWNVMRQAQGLDPVSINTTSGTQHVHLDWNRILDPLNGLYSGYMPPYLQGISRTARRR